MDTKLTPTAVKGFMSRVGGLNYLAVQTRPDILFAVTSMSRRTHSATLQDVEDVDRIFACLAGTLPGRTKHIALRYNVIREQVERQIITLQHLSGIDMPSDLLTKALGPAPFLHLRPRILGMYAMRLSPNNTPFSYYVR
jgi:hypothetical protein